MFFKALSAGILKFLKSFPGSKMGNEEGVGRWGESLLQSERWDLPEPKHSEPGWRGGRFKQVSESPQGCVGLYRGRQGSLSLGPALPSEPLLSPANHLTMISSDLNCHLKLSAHILTQGKECLSLNG